MGEDHTYRYVNTNNVPKGSISVTDIIRNLPSVSGDTNTYTYTINVGAGYNAVYLKYFTRYNYQAPQQASVSIGYYNSSNGNITLTIKVDDKQLVSYQGTAQFACIKII